MIIRPSVDLLFSFRKRFRGRRSRGAARLWLERAGLPRKNREPGPYFYLPPGAPGDLGRASILPNNEVLMLSRTPTLLVVKCLIPIGIASCLMAQQPGNLTRDTQGMIPLLSRNCHLWPESILNPCSSATSSA